MSPRENFALRDHLGPESKGRTISDARRVVSLTNILEQTCLVGPSRELSRRSVLLAVTDQLISSLAMAEIDGVAGRMLLCPPDLDLARAKALIEEGDIDAVVTDQPARWADAEVYLVMAARAPVRTGAKAKTERATEWQMLTQDASGAPKIVGHTLAGLAGAIVADGAVDDAPPVWASFCDTRCHGGVETFLRAVIDGGSMVLSEPGEPIAEYVARLNAKGVTHISGAAWHWRNLLMSGSASGVSPRCIYVSGEISDQTVLDALSRAFPAASIGHARASTDQGVGRAVHDGFAGFPASLPQHYRHLDHRAGDIA